ncbi:hypothetical protein BDR07DRAFT_1378814 [Suillus spraguei]|nr:hypothetical protein BDR07DRAFT_1378787 [Suillus spraguei]KAG2359314.1 hypothetical protein BDR07DRAFT_1378814 [Suillus spraguei]
MSECTKKQCAERNISSVKSPGHTHTSTDDHTPLRSRSPGSDISQYPYHTRPLKIEIRHLKKHIQEMEKEAENYQLRYESYRSRIQELEDKVHRLEAEAECSQQYGEGFKDMVAREKNDLIEVLRKLLDNRTHCKCSIGT